MLSAGMFSALAAAMAAAEARIAVWVSAAAGLGCDGDFLDQAGEDLATFGVKRALLMLDCGPF